jgi:hypothetical protein
VIVGGAILGKVAGEMLVTDTSSTGNSGQRRTCRDVIAYGMEIVIPLVARWDSFMSWSGVREEALAAKLVATDR